MFHNEFLQDIYLKKIKLVQGCTIGRNDLYIELKTLQYLFRILKELNISYAVTSGRSVKDVAKVTFEFQTSRSKVPSFLSTEQSRHEAVYNQQEEAVNGHLYVVQGQSKLADGSKSVTNSRVFMSQPMAVTVKQQGVLLMTRAIYVWFIHAARKPNHF